MARIIDADHQEEGGLLLHNGSREEYMLLRWYTWVPLDMLLPKYNYEWAGVAILASEEYESQRHRYLRSESFGYTIK